MVTLHEVITFLVSMQISISSLQTHNVNRCGRSRHLARKLSLRRKRSSPNVFEMAATETITSIILIKLIRVSLGTVRHPRRFKIVVIDIQITLKQMLSDRRDGREQALGVQRLVVEMAGAEQAPIDERGHVALRVEPTGRATADRHEIEQRPVPHEEAAERQSLSARPGVQEEQRRGQV